jgi:hypothetical protein
MARKTLDDLLAEDDEMGLLNVRSLTSSAVSATSLVQQQFEEVSQFIDQHGFAPGVGPEGRKASVNERKLQLRLRAYRESPAILEQLRPLDRHGLLVSQEVVAPDPTSLDEIFDLDDDLLAAPGEDIFTLRHARAGAIARPDKVSERRPCQDFEAFKPMFDACVSDLANGIRKSMPFANEQEIKDGEFFILNGITVFVAEVNNPHIRNGKRNARLRLIFENGTEGENLLRSLATELYKDPSGRRISDPEVGPLFNPEATTVSVAAPEDRITGVIYVVRSLSPASDIRKLDGHLFKIGVTAGTMEDRIRGAVDDPTFLLAPVHPVRTFDLINLNATKVENLLHRFFTDVRLDIEIMDRFGKPFRPREWFLLPLPVIEQAIHMLLDGSILRYRYDAKNGEIVQAG